MLKKYEYNAIVSRISTKQLTNNGLKGAPKCKSFNCSKKTFELKKKIIKERIAQPN